VLVNIISPFVAGFNLGTYAPLRYQGMFVSHKSWYSVVSLGHCSLFPSRVGLRTYQHPCSIFLLKHVRVVSLFTCKWYCAFGWFNKQTQCPKMDKFMNAKQQLLKTNAAVWFNTICRAQGVAICWHILKCASSWEANRSFKKMRHSSHFMQLSGSLPCWQH